MTEPIISKNCRIRYPNYLEVGEFSIIDDFCYLSTKIKIGKYCHIANDVSIAGGEDFEFELGDYSSISAGVRIWCRTNDYVNDLIVLNPLNKDIKDNHIEGNVYIGKYTGIGSNSVIMPNNNIPNGVSIGALSFVPSNFKFKEWSVYAGIPIRFIKNRNKENVLKQVKLLEK